MMKSTWLLFVVMTISGSGCNARPQTSTPKKPKPLFASAAAESAPPKSWSIPAWYIDGQNITGAASDSNNCTSASTPCLTWNEINNQRWGCLGSPVGCPRIAQNTTITFLSGNAASDVAYWLPAVEKGAIPQISCPLSSAQQVCTGTITVTQPKVRTLGANHLLTATICAGAAANEFAVNITHPSAAWTESNVSGNTWTFSQPYTRVEPPFGGSDPPEVDTWATGDTVTLYQPVEVNLAAVKPLTVGYPTTGVGGLYVQNCNIVPTTTMLTLDPSTLVLESRISSGIEVNGNENAAPVIFINDVAMSFVLGSPPVSAEAAPYWQAGILRSSFDQLSLSLLGGVVVDSDITVNNVQVDDVYIAAGRTVTVSGSSYGPTHTGQVSNFIWGPGTFNLQPPANFLFSQNTVASAMLASSFQINGHGTGCATTNAAPAVTNCGIAITGAHMDAAAGTTGFGGLAWTPVGASFSDLSATF